MRYFDFVAGFICGNKEARTALVQGTVKTVNKIGEIIDTCVLKKKKTHVVDIDFNEVREKENEQH